MSLFEQMIERSYFILERDARLVGFRQSKNDI